MKTTESIKAWNELTPEQQQGYMALVLQRESGKNLPLKTIVYRAVAIHDASRYIVHDEFLALDDILFDEGSIAPIA